MKPFTVAITVDRPQSEVFEFLDVLGNHESFCDHMLTDWTLSGPRAGVGAKARMKLKGPGPATWIDMTVIESVAPTRTVERSVSAGGRRRSRGTYVLSPSPDGGTRVSFEIVPEVTLRPDRLLAPLFAPWLRKQNMRAMERLKAMLESGEAERRSAGRHSETAA